MGAALWIYLYTVLNSLVILGWTVLSMWTVACIGIIIQSACDGRPSLTQETARHPHEWDGELKLRKSLKIVKPLVILSIAIGLSLVPSKSDMKLIIGGAIVYSSGVALSEVDGVQELPENLVAFANEFLTEFKPKESKNAK